MLDLLCLWHFHVSKYTFVYPFRQYNVDYKLDTYLKIARLYLEDDDPVQAEAYINRASLLQNESSNEQLQIHYKVHSDFMSTGWVCITVTVDRFCFKLLFNGIIGTLQ